MQAQGFGRKGAPVGGASFGNAMPPRNAIARPAPAIAPVDDPYAAQRASFIAQEAASGSFIDNPDQLGTMAWHTPTSGRSWDKSMLIAYLLWLLVGAVAAHRLYLGRYLSAGLQTVLGVLGFCALIVSPYNFGAWAPMILGYGTWRLVDLFLIPSMCRTPPAAY